MGQAPAEARDYDPEDPPRFGEWVRVQGAAGAHPSPRAASRRPGTRWRAGVAGLALVAAAVVAGLVAIRAGHHFGVLQAGSQPLHLSAAPQKLQRVIAATVTVQVSGRAAGSGLCVGDGSVILTSRSLLPYPAPRDEAAISVTQSRGGLPVLGSLLPSDDRGPADRPSQVARIQLSSKKLKPVGEGDYSAGRPPDRLYVIDSRGAKVPVTQVRDERGDAEQEPRILLRGPIKRRYLGGPVVSASGQIVALLTDLEGRAGAEGSGNPRIQSAWAVPSRAFTKLTRRMNKGSAHAVSGMRLEE
jgi:hypothetical protein